MFSVMICLCDDMLQYLITFFDINDMLIFSLLGKHYNENIKSFILEKYGKQVEKYLMNFRIICASSSIKYKKCLVFLGMKKRLRMKLGNSFSRTKYIAVYECM